MDKEKLVLCVKGGVAVTATVLLTIKTGGIIIDSLSQDSESIIQYGIDKCSTSKNFYLSCVMGLARSGIGNSYKRLTSKPNT